LNLQLCIHLNHTTSPFCSGYFGDRVSLFFFAQARLNQFYLRLPAAAGLTGVPLAHSCGLRWGLSNSLPGLASNCDPPDLSLPRS
jgi:hypothetical protein